LNGDVCVMLCSALLIEDRLVTVTDGTDRQTQGHDRYYRKKNFAV